MSDFWVGNFRVDVSRAQIIVKDDIVSLEPRVLKVLLTLAKTPGEVVTHETLLESAWPNVVVAPNAVQRCIGQLRKALGDDAKQQKMIATHPKVGYSLVAKVQWPETNALAEETQPKVSQNTQQKKQKLLAILLVSVCLLALILYFLPAEKSSLPISRITPITSTDEKEYYPNFSPNGRYLVFNRFVNVCENELWAKDLLENREFKLTENSGFYGPADWSPDGNQLAFSMVGGCELQQQVKRCRNISAMSFLLAKTKPQVSREILGCDKQNYGAINWLTNNEIAYIDTYARQGVVKSLTIDSGEIKLLYTDQKYTAQALIYSVRNKNIAITVHDEMQNTSLVFFNIETNTANHVQLDVPADYKDFLWWDPTWHPLKDTLLASAESSLFEIDMDGTFVEYPVTSVKDIYNAAYHPDGNKIVAVMGGVDFDIEEYYFEINNVEVDDTQSSSSVIAAVVAPEILIEKHQTIHHSTVVDYQAKYQPQTANISFVSDRSGDQQIWLSQNEQLKQLSHFTSNTHINSYVWSLDGQSLALGIKGKLQLLTLDGQAQLITTSFKVIDVYQWVGNQQVLLSIIEQASDANQNQQRKVVLFNINTGEHKSIYQGFSHWAQLDNDQSLYYTDWEKTLYLYQGNESIIFQPTANTVFSSGFKLVNEQLVLFGQGKLWSYQLGNRILSSVDIATTSSQIASFSDIDDTNKRVLFTVFKNARKDLVMFQR
jgi:DNA-binding winged helix-turn-helix (wHTH) protein/Tol biopolymer transport system component